MDKVDHDIQGGWIGTLDQLGKKSGFWRRLTASKISPYVIVKARLARSSVKPISNRGWIYTKTLDHLAEYLESSNKPIDVRCDNVPHVVVEYSLYVDGTTQIKYLKN